MLKNYLGHKRNTSESIKISSKPKSTGGTVRKNNKGAQFNNAKHNSHTLSLVEKSSRKLANKRTVV